MTTKAWKITQHAMQRINSHWDKAPCQIDIAITSCLQDDHLTSLDMPCDQLFPFG